MTYPQSTAHVALENLNWISKRKQMEIPIYTFLHTHTRYISSVILVLPFLENQPVFGKHTCLISIQVFPFSVITPLSACVPYFS